MKRCSKVKCILHIELIGLAIFRYELFDGKLRLLKRSAIQIIDECTRALSCISRSCRGECEANLNGRIPLTNDTQFYRPSDQLSLVEMSIARSRQSKLCVLLDYVNVHNCRTISNSWYKIWRLCLDVVKKKTKYILQNRLRLWLS